MNRFQSICSVFFKITTFIVFASAIFISIFWRGADFDGAKLLWQILIVSVITSLGMFLYPEGKLSGKRIMTASISYYIYVNVCVLGLGFYFEWFFWNQLPMVLTMVALIGVTYWTITIICIVKDRKLAEDMMKKLEEYQKDSLHD